MSRTAFTVLTLFGRSPLLFLSRLLAFPFIVRWFVILSPMMTCIFVVNLPVSHFVFAVKPTSTFYPDVFYTDSGLGATV